MKEPFRNGTTLRKHKGLGEERETRKKLSK